MINRSVVNKGVEAGSSGEFWKMIELFSILIVVMVTHIYMGLKPQHCMPKQVNKLGTQHHLLLMLVVA